MREVGMWIGGLALIYAAFEYELYWVWFILLLIVLAAFSRAHRQKRNQQGEKR